MRSKYGNIKTEVDGIVFDSRKEARYYLYLRQRLRDGEIAGLRRQVPYELVPAVYRDETVRLKTKDKTVRRMVQRPVRYIADFVYVDAKTGTPQVIDCKGVRTKEYLIKKKMMLAFHGIEVIEV